ncbi:glucoamylase [Carbonactinospora thermoautotrophica]|uniref:Trehalase n=1 Tax=Carbonactinospora thermoautotrophica TaxID=1469144 RepID=A0A132MRD0_9ACTN|nr:glycoside hydrolase family 15 protein [Carbonactinospora thermoautotrophica]KWW99951.1 Glucoamylase [Carbonactinospora thermoautotrophica]KWX04362.1 glucoamylase [Carbonactinospora thermoautotrophica]KWX04907.1 glucoamylase [Carbonactinospora thermoautotrophica]
MAGRIEDYALIGDTQTAALVCRDGSIDWLCFPRFDSPACFAALLGTEENGRWRIAPAAGGMANRRRYRGHSLILETEWETTAGTVRVIDFMPPRGQAPDIVRVVEGLSGAVPMRSELRPRFDYGRTIPWIRKVSGQVAAVAGPDALYLRADVRSYRGENFSTVAEFTVRAGDRVRFVLTWHPSHQPAPRPVDPDLALAETERYWGRWSAACRYRVDSGWREAVLRSLVTLKALTYSPTGGIVAAPTTSLPEHIGGVRNWDYRYCWLRDATLTLSALLRSGYLEEAKAWREWLLRAIAGKPEDLQIMYGLAGERRLAEQELDWLPGYEGSRPVRIGNAAVTQFQLDVYGEVLDALHLGRRAGLHTSWEAWSLQQELIEYLESCWDRPDEGIWEVRGPRRHFVHSKVMAWVAADRMVRAVEEFGRSGDVARWRALRERIHREVCERGYDAERNTFTQYYGSRDLDAALLLIPQVGFLPPDDKRVIGTVEAIQRELSHDGFIRRYATPGSARDNVDGLPGGEGAFLACTFWLADDLALMGRLREARELFERLLDLRNDVGLLAEQWDPDLGRQVGNFPQAFSHVALVNTAHNLSGPENARRARTGRG